MKETWFGEKLFFEVIIFTIKRKKYKGCNVNKD